MSYDEALENFGKALGNLKRSYAEEHCANPNYLTILIDESNYITIIQSISTGSAECHIESVNID